VDRLWLLAMSGGSSWGPGTLLEHHSDAIGCRRGVGREKETPDCPLKAETSPVAGAVPRPAVLVRMGVRVFKGR